MLKKKLLVGVFNSKYSSGNFGGGRVLEVQKEKIKQKDNSKKSTTYSAN